MQGKGPSRASTTTADFKQFPFALLSIERLNVVIELEVKQLNVVKTYTQHRRNGVFETLHAQNSILYLTNKEEL